MKKISKDRKRLHWIREEAYIAFCDAKTVEECKIALHNIALLTAYIGNDYKGMFPIPYTDADILEARHKEMETKKEN